MEENNNNIEKVYELIEQYEFVELSEADRLKVLSVMTEDQYTEMRSTIDNVKLRLENDIEPVVKIPQLPKQYSSHKLSRYLNYPLKLYQVAAGIAILIASFFMVLYSKDSPVQITAENDTVFIRHTDSVFTIIYDTVEIMKENVRNIQSNFSKPDNNVLITHQTEINDCSNKLCPNEITDIIAMNGRNTVSSDSVMKDVLLSLN